MLGRHRHPRSSQPQMPCTEGQRPQGAMHSVVLRRCTPYLQRARAASKARGTERRMRWGPTGSPRLIGTCAEHARKRSDACSTHRCAAIVRIDGDRVCSWVSQRVRVNEVAFRASHGRRVVAPRWRIAPAFDIIVLVETGLDIRTAQLQVRETCPHGGRAPRGRTIDKRINNLSEFAALERTLCISRTL